MQCASCGTDNSERVKFCAECGSPMGVPCPECSFRNAHNSQVCGGCGRSLSTVTATIAERRQLTVFFADIVGSTTLAESLDPEDLHELYARYQALCADVIQRYGGHLAQYLGDGVLAYFGYPAAHEDDAQRGVRSGLDILAGAGNISVGGHCPRVRIGIHTGLVVVGDVGAGLRREQLALGEAPNIAARLQSEALPDTMVISDATRNLLGGQFALDDLGSRTLKGLSRPLHIFRVLGKSGARSRFHGMTAVHGLTPFVGRENEINLIRSVWEQAAAGHGQTLVLRGEAGIGKSRLLAATRQTAGGQLHEVFEGECSPYQMNSPLNPIVGMIGQRLGLEESTSPAGQLDLLEQFAAGRGVAPEEATVLLAELFSVPTAGRYQEIQIDPARRRQRLIEILAALLVRCVGGSPTLLMIEDVHWADPSTLDLLGEIVVRQAEFPVLVVCTGRPEFSPSWLGHPNCRVVQVTALAPDDTRALVSRVAGSKPLPRTLVEELVLRTGGIPVFVEAVTRTVMEAGILRELDDRYELTGPLPAGMIPVSVQDSLMGRIDLLGGDRGVAQLAATIGRESSFELLQMILGKSTAELTRSLRRLVELELVSENGVPPAATYVFKHALIQDAAYESLLRKTRQEFHGRIAEALTQRFPEMAETKPELVARHFEGAGRIAEATAGWMKAGSQAQDRYALRECMAYMQKAIALLQTLPEDDPGRLQAELEAQRSLSTALASTIGWASTEVETVYLRVRDLSQKLGDTQSLVRSLLGLAGAYLVRGDVRRSFEAAQPVAEIAVASGSPELQIVARHTVGYAAYFLADFVAAREHGEKGLALHTRELERGLLARYSLPSSCACGNFRMMSLWFLGYPEAAERQRAETMDLIEWLDKASSTVFGVANILMIHFARRDRAQVESLAERLAVVAEEGYPLWFAQARIYRGWAQAIGGGVSGLAELRAGMESYWLTASGLMAPQLYLMLAEALWQSGQADEAREALSTGMAHAEKWGELVHQPELYRLDGEILLAQGNAAAAEARFQRALELARAQQARMLELKAALPLARLWRTQGRESEVRALLEPLDEWFQEGRDLPELLETRTILDAVGHEPAAGLSHHAGGQRPT